MAQSTMSIRINSDDKMQFERFCESVGMNPTVAVNMFVKTVIRKQRIPFKIEAPDPFYSSENMTRLKKSIQQMEAGNFKEHELIEVKD
jgi:DNA-damage-inducible protein J